MEIEFYGANCFRIKTKQAAIVVDDTLQGNGKKSILKEGDVAFYTQKAFEAQSPVKKARLVIDGPGEYEVGDVSVKALQTRSHMDEKEQLSATVFQLMYGSMTVTILGHVHPDLADDVLELIGGTDVILVPVGGNGYTLDAVGATSVIKKVEPEVVIPSHYELPGVAYEVPQAPLDEFLKTAALQTAERRDSYKIDKVDPALAGQTHIVELQAK